MIMQFWQTSDHQESYEEEIPDEPKTGRGNKLQIKTAVQEED